MARPHVKARQDRVLGECAYCGKQTYSSRKRAKLAIRQHHPGDSTIAAYQCTGALKAGFAGLWHIGHLFTEVVHGEMGRHRQAERS